MSGPLTKDALIQGLADHLAESLGIDAADGAELEGAKAIAAAALAYFSASVKGAPPGASRTLLWAIHSALWEGKVEQRLIDQFFSHAEVDLARMFGAWAAASTEAEQPVRATLALVPGSLDEADIAAVAAALYRQQPPKAG